MRVAVLLPVCLAALVDFADAASLQVAPVLVEVRAPGATATITVRNNGATSLAVQMRVFRWSQSNGEEQLEPTEDVVASPPAVELRPQQDYVVRIVRTTAQPVIGEESYRLFVDELPDPQQYSGVRLVVRHSLPVFFEAASLVPAEPVWGIARTGPGLKLSVANHGDRRIRLSAVSIRDGGGRGASFGQGLVGYALGRSTMSWTTKGAAIAPGTKATIKGNTEQGAFSATATVQIAR